jgi:hypothetical protein
MTTENVENDVNENEQEDTWEDFDSDSWVPTGSMRTLPTGIFKGNLLPNETRKLVLKSEPKNKDISFVPPLMDKRLWSKMPRFAREQDKNLRRVIYKVSSAIRPIDNTLRMVYASRPEEEGDNYEDWVQLEQTVLNTRALVLDALSFTNELRREQALKTTISPNYQTPSGKEEVFGDDLNETIKVENEANKIFNDAMWQKKRATANNNKSQPNLTFKAPFKPNYSKKKNYYGKRSQGQGKFQDSGNGSQGGPSVRQNQS